MKIIIDGCDGTGKTTLVNFLAEKTGFKIVKFSQPKTDNPFEEFIEYYKKDSDKYVGDNVILDRCWICEMVYGPLIRGKGLTTQQRNEFIRLTKNDLYIIAHTKNTNIKTVFEERGEDFINYEQAIFINEKFLRKGIVLSKKLNLLFYDFTYNGKDLEQYFNTYIKEKLGKQK